MSSRRVAVLFIAALLVIAGAIWLSSQRHLDRSAAIGGPFLPELKATLNDVGEIRIARANGQHTTLKKSGADWLVQERGFAADVAKVRKLLLDLAKLEVVEEKTDNPQNYAVLNVEDVPPANPASAAAPKRPKAAPYDATTPFSATRIDIVTPKQTWSVIAGKGGGYQNGYARRADAKQSFLVSPRLDVDVEPQRWLEHTLVDIAPARIRSVAMKPATGPAYTVSREKKEQENFTVSNVPARRKLAYDGSGNALARGLEGLSLDDVQNADAAASPPARTTVELSHATYKTFDGLTVEVAGRKESAPGLQQDDPKVEKFLIALTASSDQKAAQAQAQKLNARAAGKEFEISGYKYAEIFKPMEDLLEALPEAGKKS